MEISALAVQQGRVLSEEAIRELVRPIVGRYALSRDQEESLRKLAGRYLSIWFGTLLINEDGNSLEQEIDELIDFINREGDPFHEACIALLTEVARCLRDMSQDMAVSV